MKSYTGAGRQTFRLRNYDYGKSNSFFVTTNCHDRKHRFGVIVSGKMYLNEYGRAAYDEWFALPQRFPTVALREFVIMPDHMHGIVCLDPDVELPTLNNWPGQRQFTDQTIHQPPASMIPGVPPGHTLHPSPRPADEPITYLDQSKPPGPDANPRPNLGAIVGAFKSSTFTRCLNLAKKRNLRLGKFWQRLFRESIIHDRRAFLNIARYIRNNPAKWGRR